MKRCVGLDVSQDQTALCILDGEGRILVEGSCATEPEEILKMVARGRAVEKIVHEPGPLSIWLTRELKDRGAPIVCIDARAAHKALSARMNREPGQAIDPVNQLPGERIGQTRKR
ncbi:MAG: hypothetical protein AAGC81_18625 [Pseudomonadota bacterium]